MPRSIQDRNENVKRVIEKLQIHQSNNSHHNTVTNQYGFCKFNKNKLDKTTRFSQYIRLALTTEPETVVRFMKDAWELPTPDLIISISGGAKNFDLPARLRKAFQLGIVSVAATTNAWIITPGTNTGVVKEVGEALNKYRYTNQKEGLDIPCIGIASWGYTAGKEQLEGSPPVTSETTTNSNGHITKNHHNRYSFATKTSKPIGEAADQVRSYVVKTEKHGECDLEPNHTHFLLFDDDTAEPEHILPLRANIEKHSRRMKTDENIMNTLTPIVMVLLEGGQSAANCVYKALDARTPVVVVKNSGRVANLIAELHEIFSKDFSDNPIKTGENKDDQRQKEIDAIFAKYQEHKWIKDVRQDLCRALNNRKELVTIFDFDNEKYNGKLENAILDAVFNAKKPCCETNEQNCFRAELRLTLAWNNIDHARKEMFTDSTISSRREEDMRLGLVDAIRRGYIEFIELFIEYGTTLEKLTIDDLELLYNKASVTEGLPLNKPRHSVATREQFYAYYLKNSLKTEIDKNIALEENASRELFFWAIFLDRFDFALYLCSKTFNQCAGLLYGARIYQKASSITLDSRKKHQYENNAKTLDKYAASIIDRCFDVDRHFAVELLNPQAVAPCEQNLLDLALEADCRTFLASKCVQKHLDNKWFGNIDYNGNNINFRIFLCSLFFPFLPIFCIFLPYVNKQESLSEDLNYDSSAIIPLKNKIKYFYKAPIVKFYYNLIFFFFFLGLFSYVLLLDYFPLNIYHGRRSGIIDLPMSIPEMWLHVCIWGIIIEECHQICDMSSYSNYFIQISNKFDVAAIFFYLIAFITRFIVIEEFFIVSKIALGFDLILWYIRILHLFAAYERLGPKLIMIINTMKDLLFFVCFILIFLFGFSITSWALLITPSQVEWIYNDRGDLLNISINANETNVWSWKLLRDMTNYGVWKVFGQVDLIETRNPYSAFAFILAILFVTISNVLLLNVLIALFNVTIENIQDQSHDIWRYQRYLIINEFRNKSLLPPPFNTFSYAIDAILRFTKRQRKRYRNHTPVHDEEVTIGECGTCNEECQITESMQRETAIAEDFWRDILQPMEEKMFREYKSHMYSKRK